MQTKWMTTFSASLAPATARWLVFNGEHDCKLLPDTSLALVTRVCLQRERARSVGDTDAQVAGRETMCAACVGLGLVTGSPTWSNVFF